MPLSPDGRATSPVVGAAEQATDRESIGLMGLGLMGSAMAQQFLAFPTRVRAAGSGIAYNVGRFSTALGVLAAGGLFAAMGGSYPKVRATCGLIYLLGLIVLWWVPDTAARKLDA